MSKSSLTRRAILRGAGGAALSLPFLRSVARAEPSAPPKNIIFVMGGNGYRSFALRPNPSFLALAQQVAPGVKALPLSAVTGNISQLLAPLSTPSLRAKTTIISGTNLMVPMYGNHDKRSALGAFAQAYRPSGYSKETIDVIAARSVYGALPPRFKLAVFGHGYYPPSDSEINSSSPLSRLVTTNLESAFDQLFSGLTPSTDPTVLRRELLKQRLLDDVKPDYDRIKNLVTSGEREQIDRHLQSLAEIGDLLRYRGGPGCTSPTLAARPSEVAPAPIHFSAVAQMVVAAIRCSLCNVFVVGTDYISSAYHGVSHADDSSPGNIDAFLRYKQAQTNVLAELATRLEAAGVNPLTDRPYLEDTLIVYLNECGDMNAKGATTRYNSVYFTHNHTTTNMQVVTVGNLDGKLRTGVHIDYSQAAATPFNGHPVGAAYNSVLVTLANALGIDPASYEKGEPGIGDYRGFAANNITPQNHGVDTAAGRRASLPYFWVG
jgi:hypothetical protein